MKSKVYTKLKKQGVISSKVKLGDLKNLLDFFTEYCRFIHAASFSKRSQK